MNHPPSQLYHWTYRRVMRATLVFQEAAGQNGSRDHALWPAKPAGEADDFWTKGWRS
jgi:hypothetical protein